MLNDKSLPSVDIFIRTYSKDLPWLQYALKSIHKFCRGFRNIIIVIPKSQLHFIEGFNLTKEKIFTCPDYKDDYLGQQITKLHADEYTDADYVFYGDSDTLVTQPITPKIFTRDGKPLILKTSYDKVGDAIMWKDVTEKAIGCSVDFEFMRRHPFCYHTSTLKALRAHVKEKHGIELEDYIQKQPRFSEFNTVGAFADKFENDKYEFQNTDDGLPPLYMRQFRSWDGITSETLSEIESILRQ